MIASQDLGLLRPTQRGCGEGAGPPIRTAAEEEGERKEQLTAPVVEKQEL